MRSYREDEWREVRAKGKGPFLFRTGFLGRGVPMGVVTALAIELYLGGRFPDALLEWDFLARLALAVGVFTLSGCLAANANWSLHERRYAERPAE